MADWNHPPQLRLLSYFYAEDAANPGGYDDDAVLETIEVNLWGTDCWSFVEQAFAVIAPACSRRPHLIKDLIRHPISAMIAGGLEDPKHVIAQGVALAKKENPSVEPTDEGRAWLLNEWPLRALRTLRRRLWQTLAR